MLLTLSLVTLGLVSNWPLSVMCKMPPEQISWSSTLPLSRSAIFTYWWDQIFRHNWAGTWEDISSTPKRSVSSPNVKFGKLIELSDISRTCGSLEIHSDCFVGVCKEMSDSERIFSKSMKLASVGSVLVRVGSARCIGLPSWEVPVADSEESGLGVPSLRLRISISLDVWLVTVAERVLFGCWADVWLPTLFRVPALPDIVTTNYRWLHE